MSDGLIKNRSPDVAPLPVYDPALFSVPLRLLPSFVLLETEPLSSLDLLERDPETLAAFYEVYLKRWYC